MSLSDEIQESLVTVADEIWSTCFNEDGFTCRSKRRGLKSILKGFEDRMFDEYDDEWGFPWGLEANELVAMNWERGIGSYWSMTVLLLPSHRRMYIQTDDWSDQQLVLSVSEKHATTRVDRKVLQCLFRDNGQTLDTGLFGSPPDSVSSFIKSFPFLVDLFVAGFDKAGEECWEALMENWEVWDEEYENPEDPIPIPVELLAKAEEEIIRKHGKPRSLPAGLARQGRVLALANEMIMKDEIDEFILDDQFRRRAPQHIDVKIQMVARYLCQVL